METIKLILLIAAGVVFAFFVIRGIHRGWREENEARNRAAHKFPQPDDMERREKENARRKNYK